MKSSISVCVMSLIRYSTCVMVGFLFSGSLFSACLSAEKTSNASAKGLHREDRPPLHPFSQNVASTALQKEASEKVKAIIRKFNDADCSHSLDRGSPDRETPDRLEREECQKLDYSWTPAQPQISSQNQRILILEDRLPPHSIFGRYRNRVLGIYDIDKDGTQKYFPTFPKAKIYSAYNELGDYLSRLPHVPVEALDLYNFPGATQIADVQALNYVDHEPGPAPRHQEALFELMADLNPHAQFVFARYPSFGQAVEMVCDYLKPNEKTKIIHYYYGAALSLLDLVKQFGITHVNASFGLESLESLKRSANTYCGESAADQIPDEVWKEILDLERAPFEALEKAQNTIVFKSLDNFPEYEPNPSRVDYINECTPYSNFIRVAYLEVSHSNIPLLGSNYDRRLVRRNQQINKNCADIYVNGGFFRKQWGDPVDIGPKPLSYYNSGLQMHTATDEMAFTMSTSWATPLALSYSIFIQEAYRKSLGQDPTLEATKLYLNPEQGKTPWMIDPLFHDLFELYQH